MKLPMDSDAVTQVAEHRSPCTMYLGQLEPLGPSPVWTSAPQQSERSVVLVVDVVVLVEVVEVPDVVDSVELVMVWVL